MTRIASLEKDEQKDEIIKKWLNYAKQRIDTSSSNVKNASDEESKSIDITPKANIVDKTMIQKAETTYFPHSYNTIRVMEHKMNKKCEIYERKVLRRCINADNELKEKVKLSNGKVNKVKKVEDIIDPQIDTIMGAIHIPQETQDKINVVLKEEFEKRMKEVEDKDNMFEDSLKTEFND